MASSPVSGRSSRGLPSHFGPPMAAMRMESAAWQLLSVASGQGEPVASMAQPPRSCSSNSKLTPAVSPAATRAFTVAAVISGPMPSPGLRGFLDARRELPPRLRLRWLGRDVEFRAARDSSVIL